ncbi:methyl-accepting chemotaxis protein [Gloeothece verrucosa]|uniref:Uncharacterized protein n=1 Tax=Gloeothece verrucosa (strain PCC 7822) TaxID=497965 RepID=E0UHQ5_GLOV7|nr:methyl-accepting chemotaxis protein [Gloeothece verrucosa]ADN13312.1 hypothetical protein Cyan7822_1311 [Gloeothece verrucosa PCC 7822]
MGTFWVPKKTYSSPQQQPAIDVPAETVYDVPNNSGASANTSSGSYSSGGYYEHNGAKWPKNPPNEWKWAEPAPPNAPKLPGGEKAWWNNPKPYEGRNPYQKPNKYLEPAKGNPFEPAPTGGGGAGAGAVGAGAGAAAEAAGASAAAISAAAAAATFAAASIAPLPWLPPLTSDDKEKAAIANAKAAQQAKNSGVAHLEPAKTYPTMGVPPTAGMREGVQYVVTFEHGGLDHPSGNVLYTQTNSAVLPGPIKGEGTLDPSNSDAHYGILYGDNQLKGYYLNYQLGIAYYKKTIFFKITSITRADGQPDTDPNSQPIIYNYTTNNTYNTTYVTNNATNYANDSPGKPSPSSSQALKPQSKPLTSTNSQTTGLPETATPPQPWTIPSWHPGNTDNPFQQPQDTPEPQRLPSVQPSKFPGQSFPTAQPTTETKDKPKKFEGLPQGFVPLVPKPELQNQTEQKTGTPEQKPTSDTDTKYENPSEYTPSQQMGQCCGSLSTQNANNSKKIDDVDSKLAKTNTLLSGLDFSGIAEIRAKLEAMDAWQKAKQVLLWKYLLFMRVIAILTFAATVHNALMLTRSIGDSLVYALNNVLTLFGIKDADEVEKGISEAIGKTIEATVKTIIGEANYASMSAGWKKLSTIYNSATRVVQLLGDSLYGIAEGIEIVAKYTGKLGNALERSGTIIEGIAGRFSELFTFKIGRLGAISRVLEKGQEMASDLEQITSEAVQVAENCNEIKKEINTIKGQIDTDEKAKETEKNAAKTASQGTNITQANLVKPAPTE